MKNQRGEGNNVLIIAPAALTAGVAIQLSSGIVCIPASTVVSGATCSVSVKGDFSFQKKVTAEAWAVGQKLYWVAASSSFTTTATGNGNAVGFASQAALAADTTGSVCLVGAVP